MFSPDQSIEVGSEESCIKLIDPIARAIAAMPFHDFLILMFLLAKQADAEI